MSDAIGQTKREAYAHHIQRLMVTGNFALLAGVIGRLGLMMLVPVTGFPGAPVGAIQPASAAEALANAAILPLRITALVFICAGLAHLMLKLAGDPPRPFEASFRVYAYAEVSSLLLLLSW